MFLEWWEAAALTAASLVKVPWQLHIRSMAGMTEHLYTSLQNSYISTWASLNTPCMQLAKYIWGFRIKLLFHLNWMFTYSNLINRKYLTDIPSWNIHLCIIVITQSHFTKVYLQLYGFAQVMSISNLLYVILLFTISLDTFGFITRLISCLLHYVDDNGCTSLPRIQKGKRKMHHLHLLWYSVSSQIDF